MVEALATELEGVMAEENQCTVTACQIERDPFMTI